MDLDNELEIFKPYTPFPMYANRAHPETVSQTISLACVSVTPPNYKHSIPENWLLESSSRLSGVQMDAVMLAGAAHEHVIDGFRQGFIMGDGTGVGKGRQIVGMIVDNWFKNRKKALWVSSSSRLYFDADRDIKDVLKDDLAIPLFKVTKSAKYDDGVLFASYRSLKPDVIQKLLRWLGKKFDGLIVLDEAHKAKGLVTKPGLDSEGTNVGIAVEKVQQVFPNARFVYATATFGTTPDDLQYIKRLGLWDEQAGFGGAEAMKFFRERGLAGSEVLSSQLKSRGVMVSRQLSYSDLEFDVIDTCLCEEFIAIHNKCAKLWSLIGKVMPEGSSSSYWATTQSFFKTMCIASKLPSLEQLIRTKLADQCSVVMSLTSTHEEIYGRFLRGPYHDPQKEVFSPCKQMIEEFLTMKLGIHFSKLGLMLSKPENKDSGTEGPASSKRMKVEVNEDDEVIEEIVSLFLDLKNKLPLNPLDVLRMKFGESVGVVELTSRKNCQKLRENATGSIEAVDNQIVQHQSASQFQNGSCRLAIISEASSTGISLHCGNQVANQQQRVQIVFETPWTSLSILQTLGRTHRSHQVTKPQYILLTSPFPGEKRFVNAVAGRIRSLGALCTSDRRSSFNETWKSFQICPHVAKGAIVNLLRNIIGNGDSTMNLFPPGNEDRRDKWATIVKDVGLIVASKSALGWMPCARLVNQEKFLNRLLVMEYEQQKSLMKFFKKAIERELENSPLAMNDGVEAITSAIKGKLTIIKSMVYKNPVKQLVCKIHWFDVADLCPWSQVIGNVDDFRLARNGKLIGVKITTSNLTVKIFKPQKSEPDIHSKCYLAGYKVIDTSEAKKLWIQQVEALYNGSCSKGIHMNCSSGITCTSHRKSVYEFALFTGVISTVLVDLIQIVGDKDMRLFYHSWNGESDTGIFIRDKNIIIVEQCLVKAGFAKLDC